MRSLRHKHIPDLLWWSSLKIPPVAIKEPIIVSSSVDRPCSSHYFPIVATMTSLAACKEPFPAIFVSCLPSRTPTYASNHDILAGLVVGFPVAVVLRTGVILFRSFWTVHNSLDQSSGQSPHPTLVVHYAASLFVFLNYYCSNPSAASSPLTQKWVGQSSSGWLLLDRDPNRSVHVYLVASFPKVWTTNAFVSQCKANARIMQIINEYYNL